MRLVDGFLELCGGILGFRIPLHVLKKLRLLEG